MELTDLERNISICGLQKTTLLDFPGQVAATVFTGGCNFCCPFCHNSEMLQKPDEPAFTVREVLAFLKKRRGILKGVCITGGEPTLQPGLEELIRQIRGLGLLVKLDTNGYRPKQLKDLIQKGLLDYVAMDIKAGMSGYGRLTGIEGLDFRNIQESAACLMAGGIPYEFRTTVVKGLHTSADFEEIGQWLCGCPSYYLQCFVDSDQVLTDGLGAYGKEEMLAFAKILEHYDIQTQVRGI